MEREKLENNCVLCATTSDEETGREPGQRVKGESGQREKNKKTAQEKSAPCTTI